MTRFFCNVKPNYDLSDHVYMITAVTNTWDARDLTDEEKDKIVQIRWDRDTHYYDVFETQEEYAAEQKRLDEINAEYEKNKEYYLKNCKGGTY